MFVCALQIKQTFMEPLEIEQKLVPRPRASSGWIEDITERINLFNVVVLVGCVCSILSTICMIVAVIQVCKLQSRVDQIIADAEPTLDEIRDFLVKFKVMERVLLCLMSPYLPECSGDDDFD